MNKKELKVIAVIILIITLILIWVIVAQKGKENKEGEKNKQTTNIPTTQNVQKEEKEEFVEIKQDGTKINTSNKLKEDKKFDNLTITNITIETKSNETILKAIVKNENSTKKGDYGIKLKIEDETGNTIKEIYGYINNIEANSQTTLKIKTSYDFANAYNFEIEKQ